MATGGVTGPCVFARGGGKEAIHPTGHFFFKNIVSLIPDILIIT
jgi:hypothetical protein